MVVLIAFTRVVSKLNGMPEPRPRLSTRDLLGPTALFFGALLVAVAVALGPVVGSMLEKVPLTVDQTWVADGDDATRLLDRCSLEAPRARVLDGAVQQHRRILAVRPANSDVVTLQAGTALGIDHYLIDGKSIDPDKACGESTIAATIDRVTLERATAAPTGTSEIQYDDQSAAVAVPDRRGYTYLLPFGFTPQGAYYFDPITRQSMPMTVAGTETMGGRSVTHFVASIPETDLSGAGQDPRAVLTKPASWFGSFPGVRPSQRLTATLRHQATRHLFVDQQTGVIVAERAEIDETYRFAPNVRARNAALHDFELVNLRTTLNSDAQTVREGADYAADRAWPVRMTTLIAPIIAGVLGVLLLGLGIWLLLRATPGSTPQASVDD
ncbi:hypothetical protein GOHSU_47_00160 [Gordonia hirsuta DSM 44140 = NBRC 16056]|uniref:DUF3068 domain-containing protein n=2 Tax=Gordonia hirsuta TaxID=53427 RepID=L7LC73_9ACTN|nr:hypothetical protein GOHSU_47_00160 [Gordonia hirsuta DSM 44140 = NBRC 16056]